MKFARAIFIIAVLLLQTASAHAIRNYGPKVGTITPSSGSSTANQGVVFTTTYTDQNGWQDIQGGLFLINTASKKYTNCFYAQYDQNTNKLYLRNDANTTWLGGYTPGSPYVIENSYAKLDCSQTTVTGLGVTLSVTWNITFKYTFIGSKNTYLYVSDDAGAKNGWTQKGAWTVTLDTTPPSGTIKINNDAEFTNSTSVTLNLSASDNEGGSGLDKMSFSNDNSTWTEPEPYSDTKSWTLPEGQGTKTVYVKFSDKAGNWSAAYLDTIALDTIPQITRVTSSVFSKTGDRYPTSSMVKIEVEEVNNAEDISNATVRITSASLGYDSGIQNLTLANTVFYHWDTAGLNLARDYVVEVKLTDARGQTAQDNSLTITLTPNFNSPKVLASRLDLSVPAPGISTNIVRTYSVDSGFNGPLGFGWAHTYLMHIIETPDGLVKVFNSDGSGSFFKPKGGGTYESSKGDFRTLTKNPNGTFILRGKYGGAVYFAANGKLTAIEDRNANRLNFSYTADNLLDTIIDSGGRITRFIYDTNKHLTSVADPAGRSVSYGYDGNNNLISVTDITGLSITYAYDANHNLVTITYPSGSQTFFTIDADDRLVRRVDTAENNSVSYQYAELTSEMTVTDGLGNQRLYTCSNYGLVTRLRDPAGNITTMNYDGDLNLTSLTDPNGNQTTYTYDSRGNQLTRRDAAGQVTAFTYEPIFNQVTAITDPTGKVTNLSYSPNGNLIATTYPDSSQEQFGYDSQGNVVSKTDRKGQTISFEYDSRGKLIRKSFPDTSRHSFTYNEAGYLLTASWTGGTISLTYDDSNRLRRIAYPNGEITEYNYDAGGNLSQVVYPDTVAVGYVYDQVNRLSQINHSGQTVATYTYDSMSRIARRDLQNGVYTQYAYDNNGWLSSLINKTSSDAVISSFAYTYDKVGNRLTMTTQEGTTQYVYDQLYRLIQVTPPSASPATYNYDNAGNRTSVTEDGNTTDYTSNNLNQYTQVGDKAYSYDSNGNLISDGISTYSYDYENRLISVEKQGLRIEYSYDPFGRRVSKAAPTGITNYIYDGQRVIMEKDDIGNVKAKYVYGIGIDEVLVMIRTSQNYYYCLDGLGSVAQITDSSGNVIEKYEYDAYGNTTIKDGSGIPIPTSSIGNPYGFTGRDLEAEAGLYYYRARYYDPALGRFSTPDPIGFAGGSNFYAYCLNNPVNRVDPFGMDFIDPPTGGPDYGYIDFARIIFDYYSSRQNSLSSSDGSAIPVSWTPLQTFYYNIGYNHGDPTFIQPSERYTRVPKARQNNGLVAKISAPYEDSLVRAKVPVFGLAYGRDFKEYRVEYGEGKEPEKWNVITESSTPQTKDNSPQVLAMSADQTIHGNLATWDTGLKNYVYGDEYPIDHPIDLNGVYTLRLVVVNNQGETLEDRITLEVGRVIPNIYGGTALSADKKVVLTIPEQAIKDSFRVMSIKPINRENSPLSESQKLVGEIYEFRPAGEEFTKPVTLEMSLPEGRADSGKLGIYAYNSSSKNWEYFPARLDKQNRKLITALKGLPEGSAHFAILENLNPPDEVIVSRLWIDQSRQSGNKPVNVKNLPKGYLFYNDFEEGVAGWSNRDGDVGAALSIIESDRTGGGRYLQLMNKNGGGNFASTITDSAFDASKYPWVEFDYMISKEVKINLLVKMDGRWYDIEFTDDPKEYRRLNMEKIGRIDNVIADNQWHTARFNLYEMLKDHPPLKGRKKLIVQEMIMADWDSKGYMKLAYGHNREGAAYYLDNFGICKGGDYRQKAQTANLVVTTSAPVVTEKAVEKGTLLAEDYQGKIDSNNLLGAGLFHREGGNGKIHSSVEQDEKGNSCLKISFDVTEQGDYAGYYRLLKDIDLHGYNTLYFRIRAQQGNEIVRIGLKNTKGQEEKVLLNTHLEKGLNKEWQGVAIPLKAFRLQDLSSLENVSFSFENKLGNTAGAIFIDDISFGKEITPLKLAGSESWTFKTNKAQINVHHDQLGCLIDYSDIISQRDQESWAGWGMSLNGLDVSPYEKLSFRIKKVHGLEKPNLYLDDGVRKQCVDFEKYAGPSTDWQVVEIPLEDFISRGIDISRLQGLSFVFEWERMEGAMYVADVMFVGPK